MGQTFITASQIDNVEHVFDTVALMVASTDLAAGDRVRTLGYTTIGDGGGNEYQIVAAATGTADGGEYIDLATHQAKGLFPGGVVNDKQFGVTHDGSTDDTVQTQACLDFASGTYPVVISSGIAMIEAVTSNVNIPSNSHITFAPGAEWKAITNSSDSYIVADIRNVTDVYMYNPVITGDKDTHTGGTGEQGHCLNISSSGTTDNIHVYNPKCTKAWGDGIVIRRGTNLHFYDAYCDDNRRNGITINKGINVHFHGKTVCKNTNGISPEAGFDIEPNDATGSLRDIVIDHLYTRNNTGPGMTFNIGDYPYKGFDRDVNIWVGKHEDQGSVYGLNVEKCAASDIVANVTFTDAGNLVTYTNHPFSDGHAIRFNTITSTTGISTYTTYYVINSATNTFQLAATSGGAALELTTNGSGTINNNIRGSVVFDQQSYMDNGSCGVYVNDYGATNTPRLFMNNLSILNPNEINSSSIQFGAGFAFDRKIGSGLTNDMGNIFVDKLTIRDDRPVNWMTYGIAGLDNDGSGANLNNVFFNTPIEISGYDASATEMKTTRINIDGAKFKDPYGVFELSVTAAYTITKNVYSKITADDTSVVVLTDDIDKDNSGLDLEIVNEGTGGVRFDPEATRSVPPLSNTAGKYVESTDVGASIVLRLNADGDWRVVRQIGSWSVEP
jgi:hypothetical protein